MAKKRFYTVWIKLNATDFVTYHKVTKFRELYKWLDKNRPGWRYGNVYYGEQQVGNFTKNYRPEWFDH